VGLTVGLTLGDGLSVGLGLGDGLSVGLGLGEGLSVGLGLGEGDGSSQPDPVTVTCTVLLNTGAWYPVSLETTQESLSNVTSHEPPSLSGRSGVVAVMVTVMDSPGASSLASHFT